MLRAGAFGVAQAGGGLRAKVEKMVLVSFKTGEGQDPSRLVQDETQKICSVTRNNPSNKQAAAINERERAAIKYPDGNKLMGDWKNGEKLVKAGFGMRIGSIEPDAPARQKGGNGGNCYACHAIDPQEVAAGNIGPSLTGYGALRGASDDIVKYTYDKLYNAQATVACSSMPRMGHNGILTAMQVADITAYLVSPESPLNRSEHLDPASSSAGCIACRPSGAVFFGARAMRRGALHCRCAGVKEQHHETSHPAGHDTAQSAARTCGQDRSAVRGASL